MGGDYYWGHACVGLGRDKADAVGFTASVSWVWLVAALGGADSWGIGSVADGRWGSRLERWWGGGEFWTFWMGVVKFWWSCRRNLRSAILASRRRGTVTSP